MAKRVYFLPNVCAGCEECLEACAREHQGESMDYVEMVGLYPVPMRCFHCADAPCAQICPTKAIQINEDGVVLPNPDKCIGCGSCLLVCPFGIPKVDPVKKTMKKCDLCVHRADGKGPACVQNCTLKALRYCEAEELETAKRSKAAAKLHKTGDAAL